MKIKLTIDFKADLKEIVFFISRDKPIAAQKFKNKLLQNIKNDLVNPFNYKKSIYFDHNNYRDYVYKGYTTVVRIDELNEIVYVIGILKHKIAL